MYKWIPAAMALVQSSVTLMLKRCYLSGQGSVGLNGMGAYTALPYSQGTQLVPPVPLVVLMRSLYFMISAAVSSLERDRL